MLEPLILLPFLALQTWFLTRKPTSTPAHTDQDILAVVKEASASLGLPSDQLSEDFDLVRAGKLYDVLHLSAAKLGKDPELRTIKDVTDWLEEAPLKS